MTRIKIRRNGRYLNATADAPIGQSWQGLHQLVVSWAVPKATQSDIIAIRRELDERIVDAGPLTQCPADCECND